MSRIYYLGTTPVNNLQTRLNKFIQEREELRKKIEELKKPIKPLSKRLKQVSKNIETIKTLQKQVK